MSRNGILLFLIIAALAVGLFGVAHEHFSVVTGLHPETFWAEKSNWSKNFDMVLAGDSRTYRGLSPAEIRRVSGVPRIGNYAFSACGLGKDYLDHVEQTLDPKSTHKIIILGISPGSLTKKYAEDNNDFLARLRGDTRDQWVLKRLPGLFGFFETITPTEVFSLLKGNKVGYFQNYHPDGWVASHKLPESQTEAIAPYRQSWEGNSISEPVTAHLLAKVRVWRAQGIEIYGFMPPSSKELYEVEMSMSHFPDKGFPLRFQQAGGVWLDFPLENYHTYDGSHLRADSAIKLSQDLAQRIIDSEQHHFN
jgi:hypothetical protein